jgi:hypothetical protein
MYEHEFSTEPRTATEISEAIAGALKAAARVREEVWQRKFRTSTRFSRSTRSSITPHVNTSSGGWLRRRLRSCGKRPRHLVDASGLCSFHALVKHRPTRASLPAIKLMKSDPAAVEAQRKEIKIRYSKIFGA